MITKKKSTEVESEFGLFLVCSHDIKLHVHVFDKCLVRFEALEYLGILQ